MDATHFASLVAAAPTDAASVLALLKMALGTGFMAKLARKELLKLGMKVEAAL